MELYELKMMPADIDNCWPPDMDEHVAQLDFGASMMDGNNSVFASVMADPTMISTDSLDMMEMLKRCQENKNDYKLTFEDSGQWTTSGIGGSFTTNNTTGSPPTPQPRRFVNLLRKGIPLNDRDNHNISLQLLEKLNDVTEDQLYGQSAAVQWKDKLLDEILNNNGTNNSSGGMQTNFDEFTTWGRIKDSTGREQQPPFESDKVNSLPEVNKTGDENFRCRKNQDILNKGNSSPTLARHRKSFELQTNIGPANKRPGALISNFVEQFKHKLDDDEDDDDGSDEQFNENYVYSETYLGNGRYIDMNKNEIGFIPSNTAPIQRSEERTEPSKIHQGGRSTSLMTRSPRTFADLSPSRTAPDLKFIALSHNVPSICKSSNSFDHLLKQAKEGNFDEVLDCNPEKMLLNQQEDNDSGLGSSHSEGPSHIEDWPSLSVLLPRNVSDACSFFKTNSFLLNGNSNNIERQCWPPPRSFTSTEIRRHSKWDHQEHRPATACHNCLREIATSPEIARSEIVTRQHGFSSSRPSTQNLRLHAKELALIGLPLYDRKRNMVEQVVEGVAEVIRGGSTIVLLAALEKILADGLKAGMDCWSMIRKITGKGPITASVFRVIEELEGTEKPKNSRVSHFFQGLVDLYSLDGWFSYIVLKEDVLRQFYNVEAFFIEAQTGYRSLFARFIECLELLSVFNQCNNNARRSIRQKKRQHSLTSIAAKVPSDSRIPKSSSIPAKIHNNFCGQNDGEHDSDFNAKSGGNAILPLIFEPMTAESKKVGVQPPSRIPLLMRSRSKSTNSSNHSSSSGRIPAQSHVFIKESSGRVSNLPLPIKKGPIARGMKMITKDEF